MLKKKFFGGFTLVELLIVIAILAILAGIIIFNVTRSTIKAKDSRIITEIGQVRNVAGFHYSNNDYSFDGFDCTIFDMPTLCDDISNNMGGKSLKIVAANQTYCAEVQLNSGAWWCTDSEGRSARYDGSTTPTEPACDDTPGSEVYTCE